jgi:raffinose/stachyose/melibiose transport system substrate-binding protein
MSHIEKSNVSFRQIWDKMNCIANVDAQSPTTKSERLDMSQQRPTRVLRLGALAVPAIGALILAGCSASGGGDSESGGAESFSLSYAVTNAAVAVPYKALAEAYMEENSNVDITLNEVPNDSYGQTLTTQLNAGNASDVFQTAPGIGQGYSIITLAESDLLEPLSDDAVAVIPAGSDSQFQIDGKTYGVALGLTYVGAVENATVAGTDDIDFPTTFDGLLDTCATAVDNGKSLFALAGAAPPNTGLMALTIAATRVYADNPTWDDDRAADKTTFADTDGWHDTLQAIVDMHDAGCFQPGVEGGGFDAITNGILGGTSYAAFVPSNSAADLKQNAADVDFAIFPFPADGGKDFGILGANYSVSLNAASKNKDAAQKFIDWVASADGQAVYAKAANSIPVGTDLSSTPFAALQDVIDSGSYVPLPNSEWPNSSVYDSLGAGVQGLLTGQKTVDQVLTDMDTAWDQ